MYEVSSALTALGQRSGLQFVDSTLLRTALTHRSFLNEHADLDWEDNERLEFLGDAVLDFLLADVLFARLPSAPEGELTALRAALVRRETLARLAERLGLGDMLFMGHGEVDTGGRFRSATLCATFEAIVGALYLDQGVPAVRAWVLRLMEQEFAAAQEEVANKDPKSRLQELVQGRRAITPRYRTIRADGPDHAKVFTVQVSLGDTVCGEGQGHSKQIAAQQAALDALARADAWDTVDPPQFGE